MTDCIIPDAEHDFLHSELAATKWQISYSFGSTENKWQKNGAFDRLHSFQWTYVHAISIIMVEMCNQ